MKIDKLALRKARHDVSVSRLVAQYKAQFGAAWENEVSKTANAWVVLYARQNGITGAPGEAAVLQQKADELQKNPVEFTPPQPLDLKVYVSRIEPSRKPGGLARIISYGTVDDDLLARAKAQGAKIPFRNRRGWGKDRKV